MRIAISGSHATGKSTLLRELLTRLNGFAAIDEPYHLLADVGHVFGEPPTSDEFAVLFDHSVSLFARRQRGLSPSPSWRSAALRNNALTRFWRR